MKTVLGAEMKIIKRYRLTVFDQTIKYTLNLPVPHRILSFGWDTQDYRAYVDVYLNDQSDHMKDRHFIILRPGQEYEGLDRRQLIGSFTNEYYTYYVFEGGMVGV